MDRKKIIVIAAYAKSNCIMGYDKNNKPSIPWYCSEDFQHFKHTTMGSAIIMGRLTLDSLPGLLPGREHIFLSRNGAPRKDVYLAHSLEDAINIAYQVSESDAIYIIGGAQVIDLALQKNIVDEMILTEIYAPIDVTENPPIYFPTFDREQWTVTEQTQIIGSQKSKPENLKYQILHYTKKRNTLK